jgi:hypothetical protein
LVSFPNSGVRKVLSCKRVNTAERANSGSTNGTGHLFQEGSASMSEWEAAVKSDFWPSGRKPTHCRLRWTNTPVAGLADDLPTLPDLRLAASRGTPATQEAIFLALRASLPGRQATYKNAAFRMRLRLQPG